MKSEKSLSLRGQIDCVRREIARREDNYPRVVAGRGMRQGVADYEIASMKAVLATLQWLERNEREVRAAAEEKRVADMNACARRMQAVL